MHVLQKFTNLMKKQKQNKTKQDATERTLRRRGCGTN